MVLRRLLRKRWVLGVVFGLSLIYFLTSTLKQEERTIRDRNLLEARDPDHPIPWKVRFNLGNSSRQIIHSRQYICKSCLANGCCNIYEHCVSCCLQPDKQPLLESFLNRAADGFQNLFTAVEDHFELCLAKVSNMKIPTEIHKQNTVMEKVHLNSCQYDCLVPTRLYRN
ncbi:unnamed protein product [Coregonus sp. 'balchen']|nr:unnamed protein product [Coregonus sp. 'balchen']